MNNLNDIEEKIEEIFCKKITDQIDNYGIVRLTEMALKLTEDLERQKNSKEIFLCKKIIEFLVSLIRNCNINGSPMIANYTNEDYSSAKNNDDKQNLTGSSLQKKRPPTPPKKPKITRNFHSFQFVPSNKDSSEICASYTSIPTNSTNNSLTNKQKTQSPTQQTITPTRASSTFASVSKNNSNKQIINNQLLSQTKINAKYTETCLDKDQTEENAYEIKELGFNSKPTLSSFGVNNKIMNNNSGQNQLHNSYPRHLHSNQQLRSKISNSNNNEVNNRLNSSQNNYFKKQNSNHNNLLSYGSTDALNRGLQKKTYFERKSSLDKTLDDNKHNLRLSQDLCNDNYDEEELSVLQKSLDDNGEINFENYETEEELDKKDLETEDEVIYDTVAPDEVNLNNTSTSSMSTFLNSNNFVVNKNKKTSLVKSIKNSFENRFIDQSMENLDINSDSYSNVDNRINSNYVNIDYFLRSKNDSDDCETQMSQSLSSDHDVDDPIAMNKMNSSSSELLDASINNDKVNKYTYNSDKTKNNLSSSNLNTTYDEVFDSKKDDKQTKPIALSTHISVDSNDCDFDNDDVIKTEAELLSMYRSIIQNIIESESVYIDCLNTLIQYKKALKSSTESTQPLLRPDQLECIFYQIPELFSIHSEFISGVQELSHSSGDNSIIKIRTNAPTLGDLFKTLASQLEIYSKYLKNYSNALQTLHKCCSQSSQFNEIAKSIKLKSMKGQSTTLEELLHKPVARVQKNALVLHDLLKYTGQHLEEYKSLQNALQMTQCFLNELNVAATENLFLVQDKAQRRLVKESFIIELSDSKRKLRHLILFNDILVCAKYKPSSRQKFTFDVKWYAPLSEITLPDDFSPSKENSGEIMNLRSRVSSLRDEIYKVEKAKPNSKLFEKLKKKQADLEGQLVLLLPQLQFNILHKNSKHYYFYLSSEFERTQWVESIRVLQQLAINHEQSPVNFNELQAWIETCRKNLNPNVGSFLLRSIKDEELLYGDLYLNVIKLSNFKRSGDFYIAIETDTYGHFFQKTYTKTVKSNVHNIGNNSRKFQFRTNTMNSNNSTLSSTNSFSDAASTDDLSCCGNEVVELFFNQEFVLDLDGTQIIRFLLFEEIGLEEKPIYRGKATMEFSRNWLKEKVVTKEIHILNSLLTITLKFISSESSTIRFPAGKVYGAFGVPIQQVSKKEKSDIPYLIIGCVREVERRGMKETGVYRVSGLSSDVHKLKRAFETNPYEAEHLLKEIDIHAVTGLLKMYLRELPEALFTNALYKKFFDAFGISNTEEKASKLIELFLQLPLVNQNTINFLIEHLTNVYNYESYNKMSLNNLATVFGPTMIYPGNNNTTSVSSNSSSVNSDQFTAGTIDVMAQAGILFFFLKRKSDK